MSLPWVAKERSRQQSLREAIGALRDGDQGRVGRCPEPVGPTGPWTFAALIGWWLEAGHALHGVSQAGRQQIENRVGRGSGEGQYPPLWLAARYTALHLPPDGLLQDSAASKSLADHGGETLPAYVMKLLTWVTSRDRPRTPNVDPVQKPNEWADFLEQEFSTVVQDASALLGERVVLEAGDDVSWQAAGAWLPAWNGKMECIRCVRRPLIRVLGERRDVLIKGLVVLPLPGTFMRRLHGSLSVAHARGASADSGPDDYVFRAVQRAAERSPTDRLLSAVLSAEFHQQPRPAALIEQIFLPIARVLGVTVAETRAAVKFTANEPTGAIEQLANLRLTLALDGFEVRSDALPPDGGGRLIPHRGCTGERVEALSFTCRSKDVSIDVPVGWLGEPATCDEPLLAAIEDVDWRLWALQHTPGDDVTASVAAIIVAAAKPMAWEPLKRRILLEATDADAMSALFDFTHARRLALELLAERTGPAAAAVSLEAFIWKLGTLEGVAFERLLTLDPGAPARLDPPRLADGTVDVPAWLSAPCEIPAGAAEWQAEWIPNDRLVGTVLGERCADGHCVVALSAGSIAARDRDLLAAPVLAAGSGSLAETLRIFQTAVARALVQDAACDVSPAIDALRDVFAGDRAAAFHELIERWRHGDEPTVAWVRTLAADPRFRFACHPRVDVESRIVPPAAADDAHLDWAFDDRVPAGDDVAITFALEPIRARRVISRGPRVAGSAADLAEAVVAAAGSSGPLVDLATAARRVQDRSARFPAAAEHPVDAAARLLDALLTDAAPAEVRAAVFDATSRWCAALGHEIVPAAWSPDRILTADDVAATDLGCEFHASVPRSSVVVHRFGVRGARQVPFAGAISAGPAPAGFPPLDRAIRDLAAVGPAWAAVASRMADFAKHAMADTQRLAASNLYDAFWEAAAADAPPAAQAGIEAAKATLFEFLKAAAGLVPFEPSAVGDYPTGWIRESDGTQPRGRRIRRGVRPGLRTIDNALVRPALVITE